PLPDPSTESIVAGIDPKLQFAEIERLKHKRAASLDAYDLVLRAQQFEHEFTAESLAAAIRCTEQAMAIDRNYARAMALAAHCYGARAIQGWADNVATEAAKGVLLAVDGVERGQGDGNGLWVASNASVYLAKDRGATRE